METESGIAQRTDTEHDPMVFRLQIACARIVRRHCRQGVRD